MRRSFLSQPSSTERRGVTLTEVLISMMIMSIGVIMVMSLFPIAALRTLQATQLTNATILRYNVEAVLSQDPELIFDPDRDGDYAEHVQTNAQRNYIVDGLGFYTYAQQFQEGVPSLSYPDGFEYFGNSGAASPVAVPGFSIPRFGGGLRTSGGADWTASTTVANALRLRAVSFNSHPDGWTTEIDTVASTVETDGTGIVGVKLAALIASDLQNVGSSEGLNTITPFVGMVPDPEQYRIVVFDADERISQAFPLTYLDLENGGTEIGGADNDIEASWSEAGVATPLDFNGNQRFDARYLPVEFNGVVGRVLLQSRRTSEFSTMLSVRRRADGDARSVDVVVRFKNGVDTKDEELFPANCLGGTYIIGVKNNGANQPRLKKGGFAFDVVNAVWYRITSVQEKPAFGGAGNFNWDVYDYRVTVETQIRKLESTGADSVDGALDGDDTSTFGRVMFPTGVIEVYPLGFKEFPESLR